MKTVVIALGGNALGKSPEEQLELVKEIETLAYKLRTYINEPVHLTPNDKHRYIENKIKIYFEKIENLKKEYYERDC